MTALVLAEFAANEIKPSTLPTITAAKQLAEQVDIILVGKNASSAAELAKQIDGISNVLVAESNCSSAETICETILQLSDDYASFFAAANTYGKNIMPRLAAKLDVMQLSEVANIVDDSTFIRPIYAGNVMATYECKQPKKVITVRTTTFKPAEVVGGKATVKDIAVISAERTAKVVKLEAPNSERPELSDAEIVVSGGRALESQENFRLIEELADSLNAAIGASRAAVDAGYVPNDYQVGQTGKVVAPELYIAVGISGAIQHVAGIKDSQIIVAINKDLDAPIFQISDYGLVGDLFEIVPELTKQLKQRKVVA